MSQVKPIEAMEFKELRTEVQRLSDKLARMERVYADTLENLDDDNFSAQALKEKEKMKTDIRYTENGLELVTEEVYPDGTEAQSAIAINAEGIKTVTEEVYPDGTESDSAITVNAQQIATKVSKTLNFGEAIRGTDSPYERGDADKLYFWETSQESKKGYYYYNSISGQWIRVNDTSIYSAFIQTDDGFRLHGKVRISGDLITEGTISGLMIQTTADKQNDCARMNAENDSFEIVQGSGANGVVVGRWMHSENGSSLSSVSDATLRIGRNIKAFGTWDFTGANVTFDSSTVSGLWEGEE